MELKDPQILIAIIAGIILVIAIAVFLTGSAPVVEKNVTTPITKDVCGDGVCSPGETGESCPADCRAQKSEIEKVIGALDTKKCEGLSVADANYLSLTEKQDYCSCINITEKRDACRIALLDNLYYTNAIDTFDPSLCQYIVSKETRDACTSVSGSGKAYVEATGEYQTLVLSYLSNQNYAELMPLLEPLLIEHPDDAWLLSVAVDAYSNLAWESGPESGNATKAIELGKKLVTLKPLDSNSFVSLGHAYEAVLMPFNASDQYSKALEMDAKNIPALVGRGHVYAYAGILENATQDFLEAKELDPDHKYTEIYRQLCSILSTNDNYLTEAIEDCEIVVNSDSSLLATEKADAYISIGYLQTRAGEYDAAIGAYEMGISFLPEYAPLYSSMAHTCSIEGDYKKAQDSAQKAIAIDAGSSAAYYELSYALYKQGMLDQAETAGLKAAELLPSDETLIASTALSLETDIYANLANIYSAMGEGDKEAEYAAKISE